MKTFTIPIPLRLHSLAVRLSLGLVLFASFEGIAPTSAHGDGPAPGAYLEQNGYVIMEAEETLSDFDLWLEKATIPDFTGSGYLEFNGNSPTNGPAKSPLEFIFYISSPGLYYLDLHCARETIDGRTDLANDCYVRVEGDYAEGPNAGDSHGMDAPLSMLMTDTKFFGGAHNTFVWASGNRLDPGGHQDKRVAIYDFKAGETYRLVVSGRSKFFKLNRIVFRHKDVAESIARNLDRSESSRQSAGLDYVTWSSEIDWDGSSNVISADANGNGWPNLWQYWMNLNPVQPNDEHSLPRIRLGLAGEYLEFTTRERIDVSNFILTFEALPDIGDPSQAAVLEAGAIVRDVINADIDGDGSTALVRYRIQLTSGGGFFQMMLTEVAAFN